jgi:glycosyltransferase involved in cell wall biosynthesis
MELIDTISRVNYNIILITSNYLPKIGGIETQVNILAKCFTRRGVSVNIITETPNCHEDDGLFTSVTRLQTNQKSLLLSTILTFLSLLKNFRNRSINFIVARSITKITLIPLLIKKLNFINTDIYMFVDTYEELDYIEKLPFISKSIIKSLLKSECIMIAPSSSVKKRLLQLHYNEDKVQLIPNGIELSDNTSKSSLRNPNTFAFLGTLNLNKGINDVVNIFLEICPKFPNLTLHIAGDGPLKSKLIQRVEMYGLSSQILFVGSLLTATDKFLFLQDKQYFIFSSKIETFGLSVYEAASQGLTIFTRPIADIPKYLSDCAYFFESKNDLKNLVTLAAEKELAPLLKKCDLSELNIEAVVDQLLDMSKQGVWS